VYFWLRDEDVHTIKSAVDENPILHANITALSSKEPELSPIEVLHCENSEFIAFCCCDLDLDSMAFIFELDPCSLKISLQT